jgi:hypothetical protein
VTGQKYHAEISYLVGFLQPLEGRIVIAQGRVDERKGERRNVPAFRDFIHGGDHLPRFVLAGGLS